MQRMKKLLLTACLFWAGASQVARAEQNVNYIYKEKGQLIVHLGTIPDRFQSVSVSLFGPSKTDKTTLFGILSNEVKMGLICKYL